MKRDDWVFDYPVLELLAAAKTKQEIHQAKLKWWTEKQAEVMQNLRESGIDIKDSVAAGYAATKGIFRPQVVVDPGLQRDLIECREKMRHHTELIENYKSWIQIFQDTKLVHTLSVDHDDWQFFFGR